MLIGEILDVMEVIGYIMMYLVVIITTPVWLIPFWGYKLYSKYRREL
jgi:hypothetical protein